MPDKNQSSHYYQTLPHCYDREAGQRLFQNFQNSNKIPHTLSPKDEALIIGIGGCSPYLTRLINRHPLWAVEILNNTPQDSHQKSCDLAIKSYDNNTTQSDPYFKKPKIQLRQAKDHAALNIGLNELRGDYHVIEATKALSQFADHCVHAAFSLALDASIERGHIAPCTVDSSAICVLAMGKHGAHELNYSSDIDLIALYDRDKIKVKGENDPGKISSQIIRDMVSILNEQTADGYVFRTDLRLRPDPGVSAICISVSAAENYYEIHGQNWERAAFIKARPIAGDINIGQSFLTRLRPFIWRKYLDFAAIEDIRAIQKRITAALDRNHHFKGFDVKLGRGGIRQIEFLAQMHQLIWGGKNQTLRTPATLDALIALEKNNLITQRETKILVEAYHDLRKLEHRIQMINDEQTHQIPKDANNIERLALFSGFSNIATLKSYYNEITNSVHTIQQHQHEDTAIKEDDYIFSFSGVDDDPQTLASLQELGFERAQQVSSFIRRWYNGTYRATRTKRSHALMDQFIPLLLRSLANSTNPDLSFFAFDRFLSRLPSGVQVFSLFVSRPKIFDRLSTILTISPKLAKAMANQQGLLEALIEKGWLSHDEDQTKPNTLTDQIKDHIQHSRIESNTEDIDFENILNIVRRFSGEARFMQAARLSNEKIDPIKISQNLTRIADDTISAVVPAAQSAMHHQYGKIDGAVCVIGFGRLGNQNMTYASDIDLVIIYDIGSDTHSTGKKPIDGVTWYTRMVRRLVTALSIGTEEGKLYEVDMQLRPSGGAGPTAVKFSAFKQYYKNDAWIWEMMALTKARIICGDPVLCHSVQKEITDSLCRKRNRTEVISAVKEMRQKILINKPSRSIWDRKRILGGLTDIEFILQFLILTTANMLGLPPNKTPNKTQDALAFYHHHKHLNDDQYRTLLSSYTLNENIIQLSRLCENSVFDPELESNILTNRILLACNTTNIQSTTKKLTHSQQDVMRIFNIILA